MQTPNRTINDLDARTHYYGMGLAVSGGVIAGDPIIMNAPDWWQEIAIGSYIQATGTLQHDQAAA